MTYGFKYDMRNLVNFYLTTQKFEFFVCLFVFLRSSFCPKYTRFELQRSYLSWHWTMMQNLNDLWPSGFKNGMRNWVNFYQSTQKSENLYFDELFLSKAYNISARYFHRSYVSLHWRVTQNLKENWLVAWEIFMWVFESPKIYSLICPKLIKF